MSRARIADMVLGVWWGIVVFFVLAIPTVLFRTVPVSHLLPVLGALFPQFFAYTSGAGLVATLLATNRGIRGLLALALALQVLDWWWLVPLTDRAVGTAQFWTWHGLSLGVVLVVLGLITAAGVWAARQRAA
jgi:tetrahydromethanopterin S-methyltransferase subunit D